MRETLEFKGFGGLASLFDEKSFTYSQNNIGNLSMSCDSLPSCKRNAKQQPTTT